MKMTKLFILLNIATVYLTLIFPSESQSNKQQGQWKLLKRSLGISAMHMQLLPGGTVVAFDRTDAGPSNISLPLDRRCLNRTDCTAHSVLFDPSTRRLRPLTVTTETWCSSGALSPNGTLIQTGGFNSGDRAVRYISSCPACDWVEHPQGLAARRWYATNHILPDERIIIIGGRKQFNYEFIPKSNSGDAAVFQLPFLRETTDQWENNLYPFVHLSTDGNLFIFANTKAVLFDYSAAKVVKSFPEMPGGISRNYPSTGSSVLLPIVLNNNTIIIKAEVMVCGGAESASLSHARNGTYLPASSSCGRLVITEESPGWEMEEMPMGRVMGDMVLLPTGDVLIVNGAARGTAGWGNAREPVLRPVMYRPGLIGPTGRRFDVMSPSTIPRLYHSTAHLIPDGRVLVGGSNPNIRYQFSGVLFPTELSLEAFYPPYLGSKVNRPDITSIEQGESVVYGQMVSIRFGHRGNGADVVYVTMVSPPFTTHSFSMNQRVLVLEVAGLSRDGEGGSGGGGLKVDVFAPASAVLAPPGYYMLFVLHGGVPSRGKWIHITH